MSFNKIIIVGNLGRDPELRYTPQGVAVCDLSVATTERKKDKAGEYQDATTWFRVTLWRQQAENAAKYLTKGQQVYIDGRLGVEEWTDRDGNNRYTLKVQGDTLHFIGTKGDAPAHSDDSEQEFAGPASNQASAAAAPSSATPAAADDDIPF